MNDASKKFFIILLGVLGVTLLLMVGHNMVTIYRSSMVHVEKNESRTITCHQMFFDVVLRSNHSLEIINNVISSYDIDELSLVNINTSETEIRDFFVFSPGQERTIDISSFDATHFAVYPFDCTQMAKICSRENLQCVSYQDWVESN